MLRITTVRDSSSEVTLKLEGQIVQEWSSVLERTCDEVIDRGKEIRLDLSDVTNIDHLGVAVVNRHFGTRLQVVNCPPLIHGVLLEAMGR